MQGLANSPARNSREAGKREGSDKSASNSPAGYAVLFLLARSECACAPDQLSLLYAQGNGHKAGGIEGRLARRQRCCGIVVLVVSTDHVFEIFGDCCGVFHRVALGHVWPRAEAARCGCFEQGLGQSAPDALSSKDPISISIIGAMRSVLKEERQVQTEE